MTWRLREAGLEEPAERFVLPRLRRGAWRVELRCGSRIGGGRGRDDVRRPRTAHIPELAAGGAASVGPRKRHGAAFVVSRLTRLEDGMFSPVSTSRDTFRHV